MSSAVYDRVRDLAQALAAEERLRLIAELAIGLESDRRSTTAPPRRSAFGALKDLGQVPSADAIDEARRDMWGGFPRGDI